MVTSDKKKTQAMCCCYPHWLLLLFLLTPISLGKYYITEPQKRSRVLGEKCKTIAFLDSYSYCKSELTIAKLDLSEEQNLVISPIAQTQEKNFTMTAIAESLEMM